MEPHASRPRLELFGGPRVTTPQGYLRLSPQQELLLTLVWGQEAAGLTRRRAIGLLWETVDDRSARHRLRQLLLELRHRLGRDVVDTLEEDLMRPAPTAMASDLDTFREAVRAGDLSRALGVQRKEFGARLRRMPGEAFEDWLEAKRGRLRRELREAAAAQWDRTKPTGDWTGARDAAEVLFALDPRSEQGVRMIVEARAMTGGAEGAEAAYRSFVETLRSGERPAAETLELIERVRRLAEAASARGASASAPSERNLPMVGRDIALGAARDALDRIRGGRFEFVLLKGDTGVGKTRLLDEIAKEAHLKGFRCLRASPAELERAIPLNPLVDALSVPVAKQHVQALDLPWRAVLSAVLPYHQAGKKPLEVPPIAEASLSRRLCDAFSILFSRMAATEPMLLVIDDIHWADSTTVAVLQFTQRRWRSGPLGVIAAIRPGLTGPAEDISRYLEPGGDLDVTPIELRDLDVDDARQLVTEVSSKPLDEETTRSITELGGRNPFYLIELTKDFQAGRLQLPETPEDGVTIPISLRQLLDARFEGLSAEAMETASVLATWGRQIRVGDLAAATGKTFDESVRVIEELARWRLVEQQCDSVRFAHALFRSALYGRLNEARKVALHTLVANHLLSREPPPHDELAIHFARAGNGSRAVEHGRLAARSAVENGAFAEAAHFYQIVVEHETNASGKAEATADLARLLHMKREIARANPLLELAATRLRAVGNRARAYRMDIRRVEGLAEVGATPMSDLLDRLATIKTAARQDEDWEALALALDAEMHLLHRTGGIDSMRNLVSEVRDCAAAPNLSAACVANALLAMNVSIGDPEEGMRCARLAVAQAEQTGDPNSLFLALSRLTLVLVVRGMLLLPGGPETLRRGESLAESSGDLALRFHLSSNAAVFFLDVGELDRAEVAMEKAGALITDAEGDLLHFTHWCNKGELALERAAYEDAQEHFGQALTLLRPGFPPWHSAVVHAGAGMAALELGAIAEARHHELEMPADPPSWYLDPTLVLTFRARLLDRRKRAAAAVSLLRTHGDSLAARFPVALVRTEILASRLSRRAGLAPDVAAKARAIEIAQRLRLDVRAKQLDTA